MLKRKSLVPKLVAGVILCSTISVLLPQGAHASYLGERRAAMTQEQRDAHDARMKELDELTEKIYEGSYKGEDGYLYLRDGTKVTGTSTNVGIGVLSADVRYERNCITSMTVDGAFLTNQKYYKDLCSKYNLDYDRLVQEYYAGKVSSYPQLRWGWAKNADGQWFYSELGKEWYSNGWKRVGDKYYYFYHTGLMAHDTTVDGCYVGADGASDRVPAGHIK